MTSDERLDFYNLIREAIHEKWDPIGIYSFSKEIGEYDSYLPKLLMLLEERSSEEKIFEFLWTVETDSLGLSGDMQATKEFARWLVSLRDRAISLNEFDPNR